MNTQHFYFLAMALGVLGCTIAGLSLGLLYSEVWVGILLGLSVGVLIAAVLSMIKAKS